MSTHESPEIRGYSRVHVYISVVVSIVVTGLLLWWASGFSVFYESLFRVGPTVEGGGVGTDWVAGNTIPALDLLISLTHAADAIMGIFILLMVFVHWAAFRRLADRMREPTRAEAEEVAADGGEPDAGGGDES